MGYITNEQAKMIAEKYYKDQYKLDISKKSKELKESQRMWIKTLKNMLEKMIK